MSKTDAADIIDILGLVPLPVEGGWFKQTWRTDEGTAIYYLITPDAWSAVHRLDIAEIWHFYAGDPVKQLQLYPDGRAGIFQMGSDLTAGSLPQLVCPADVWQSTRLAEGGEWALLGTTMAPPFSDDCISFPSEGEIEQFYPHYKKIVEEFK